MKALIRNIFSLLFLSTMIIAGSEVSGQNSTKDQQNASMQQILDSKNFIFTAQSVTPQRGSFRQLTSIYDLKVLGDSVVSSLPYFGRAYTAPIDPSSGGIEFTSTSFDYTVKARKKGGWDVLIKPKDYKDVQQMFLNVFSNGSAVLQVTSNSRQPISFNGNLKGRKV